MPLHAIAMCPDAIDTMGLLSCIEKTPTDQSKKKTNWPSLRRSFHEHRCLSNRDIAEALVMNSSVKDLVF